MMHLPEIKTALSILVSKDVAQKRNAMCRNCNHLNPDLKMCKVCGCFIPVKTKLVGSCPLKKW
jgi:hypothetical protein